MKMTRHVQVIIMLTALIIEGLTLHAEVATAGEEDQVVAGYSRDEALKLGEKIYRDGILPSGKPVKAMVMGDIPAEGGMFACDDCHQRSGLGTVEGTIISIPTNGKELYISRRRDEAWKPPETDEEKLSPRRQLPKYWRVKDERPAYTDQTLARVMWTGIDPSGKKLNPVMPRYLLGKKDMDILVYYLKNLSVEFAPGVDNTTILFATVVTEDVPPEEREAMVAVLEGYIDNHNSQSRHDERRAKWSPFFTSERYHAYRRLKLAVWELKGSSDTWMNQLESYYRNEPVFGFLGGITTGSWAPIHLFCEQNRIPCIFPLTDLPVVSESDWYTLYFSKGLYQEGEAAAKYLHAVQNLGEEVRIVQVFRDSEKGMALSSGFEKTWTQLGHKAPENLPVARENALADECWQSIGDTKQETVALLWMGPEDLEHVLKKGSGGLRTIFISSGMLRGKYSIVPEGLRDRVYLAYSNRLPQENDKRIEVVKRWLAARNLPLSHPEIQSKMYFLGWMLTCGLKEMRSEYFREYFLENFDMMVVQDYAIVSYPRLSFGPGQRYASKGCYIVQLASGPVPALVKKSEWIIY